MRSAGACLALSILAAAGARAVPPVYRQAGEVRPEYRGPGREEAEKDGPFVSLAWFGPSDSGDEDGLAAWRAARLAVDDENAAGGTCGRPLRLRTAWSATPWGAAGAELARLAAEDDVVAVVGANDGVAAHLAAQIALKLRIPVVSAAAADTTAEAAHVSWLLSLSPGDDRQAEAVASALADRPSFALLVGTDHDSRGAHRALTRALRRRARHPDVVLEIASAGDDRRRAVAHVLAQAPAAVVVLAASTPAAGVVADLRRAGYGGVIVGGATLARLAFRRAAGEAAEGVMAPVAPARGAGWEAFAERYTRLWGAPPDETAGRSYDSVRLTAAALRRSGVNRARLLDALRSIAPWEGVTGTVRWSAAGRNDAPPVLGLWRDGSMIPRPAVAPCRVEPAGSVYRTVP